MTYDLKPGFWHTEWNGACAVCGEDMLRIMFIFYPADGTPNGYIQTIVLQCPFCDFSFEQLVHPSFVNGMEDGTFARYETQDLLN